MQWIILIGNKELTLEKIENIHHYNSIKSYKVTENRFCVEYAKDHIFYEYVEDLNKEYELDELNKIPFQDPNFIMMIYTSEEIMKKVIKQDNFLKDIYVDNDHGIIISVNDYIKCGMPIEAK